MSIILVGIEEVIFNMDDVLIATDTIEDNENILNMVKNRIKESGLTLNLDKYYFKRK